MCSLRNQRKTEKTRFTSSGSGDDIPNFKVI